MTPMTSPPAGEARVGEHAHQPDGAPAVDEADARAGELDDRARSAAARNCGSVPDDDPQNTHTRLSSTTVVAATVVLADPLAVRRSGPRSLPAMAADG